MKTGHLITILILLATICANTSLAQNKLCVKNSAKVSKAGKINLKSALSVTTANCPAKTTALDVLEGAEGPQGSQGPQGAQGIQGPVGDISLENIVPVSIPVSCSGSYSGTNGTLLCESSSFQKFNDDTILEVMFYGRVSRPDISSGTSAIYYMVVDSNLSQGSTGKIISRSADPVNSSLQGSMHGIYSGIPSGTHNVEFFVRGAAFSDAGTSAVIGPGNFSDSYLIIREVRLP